MRGAKDGLRVMTAFHSTDQVDSGVEGLRRGSNGGSRSSVRLCIGVDFFIALNSAATRCQVNAPVHAGLVSTQKRERGSTVEM